MQVAITYQSQFGKYAETENMCILEIIPTKGGLLLANSLLA